MVQSRWSKGHSPKSNVESLDSRFLTDNSRLFSASISSNCLMLVILAATSQLWLTIPDPRLLSVLGRDIFDALNRHGPNLERRTLNLFRHLNHQRFLCPWSIVQGSMSMLLVNAITHQIPLRFDGKMPHRAIYRLQSSGPIRGVWKGSLPPLGPQREPRLSQ